MPAMLAAQLAPYITEEEYLEGESLAAGRHEYFDGRVWAMAGATDAHELVAMNFAGLLWQHLRGKGCRVFKSDMKLRFKRDGKLMYYYPDVIVACDAADNHQLYRERPKLLVEVMSEDWKKDWVEKAFTYRHIATLEEFVIVDPNPEAPAVYVARPGEGWDTPEAITGMHAEFTLRSVGLTIKVSELFAV